MFGIVIISKRKLKEMERQAYYSGFQTARSVGFVPPTPPSNGRNTQTANTSVQEVQAEVKQAVVKQIASKNRIIESPWEIEPLIMQMCGDRTYKAISKHIIRKYGDKVLGKNRPITMNQKTVERIVKRELRYDPKTQRFINHRNNNHRSC